MAMNHESKKKSQLERCQHYISLFEVSQQQLTKCYKSFVNELREGLKRHQNDPTAQLTEDCSLLMLDCYVDVLPTNREKGVFYAVDFGGTNIRAIRCILDGQGHAEFLCESRNIRNVHVSPSLPKGLLDKRATATMLFDEIADVVGTLVKDKQLKNKEQALGFTFSFPVNQKSINSARLMNWTKDFETGNETNDPVVGQDVCALLNNALARKKLNCQTVVVLNDTVGCMIAGCFNKTPEMPPCLIGVILGTGVNGAYVQRDAKSYGYKGIVINTELGNFNKDLPRNIIDYQIDYASPIRGRQFFEKMISGLYLPELIRLLVLHIFEEEAPESAWVPLSLTGDGSGSMFQNPSTIPEVLESCWSWKLTDKNQIDMIYRIVDAVYRRSAAMASIAIAGMAKTTGCLQPAMGGVSVGVDGTLYLKNPKYKDYIRDYLDLLFDKDIADLIHLVIAEEGSGREAAMLAGAVYMNQQR